MDGVRAREGRESLESGITDELSMIRNEDSNQGPDLEVVDVCLSRTSAELTTKK